ncbi:MAG: hypothetical protein OWU33_04580 [Firmicutes bacterium]|nr:hypothetical protein [Bacillota bacterium]
MLRTIERFNAACNAIAVTAFREHTANKIRLQKLVYADIRHAFGLSAQMTVRAISHVAEAYKRDRSTQPTFSPHGPMMYDRRLLSWKGMDRVSILTLERREMVPVLLRGYSRARSDRKRGQADLIYHIGTFYLAAVIDVPSPPLRMDGGDSGEVEFVERFLAVDQGVERYVSTGGHNPFLQTGHSTVRAFEGPELSWIP